MGELVSIIMPSYNTGRFINAAIESVLAQTYQNWELLVVDDCSTDNSLELAKSFNDDRIKIFQNDTNSGAAVSRNFAIKMAKGKWIAFLDSDDIWLPEKLSEQLRFMVENNHDFSYTVYSQIDEFSNPLNIEVFGPKKIGKHKMFQYNYVGCLTVIYNAEKTGFIQVEPSLQRRNDYAIWLKVCRHCDCYLLNKNLALYRIRTNSLSHSGMKNKIRNQYQLFRYGENMCVISAIWYTMVNMVFGVLKKLFYVKPSKEQ